jgi:hypothetical protein
MNMKGGEKVSVKKGRRIGLTVVVLALFFCVALSATTTAGATTVVKVVPADQTVTAGQSFSVNVVVEDVTFMAADQAVLNFDPSAMQATGIVEGNFLKSAGATTAIEKIYNAKATFSYALKNPNAYVNGTGTLATINFDTKLAATPGKYNLNLTKVKLLNNKTEVITVDTIINGTVTINPAPVPGLSGTGMVVAIGVLAIVLAMSAMRKRRK